MNEWRVFSNCRNMMQKYVYILPVRSCVAYSICRILNMWKIVTYNSITYFEWFREKENITGD